MGPGLRRRNQKLHHVRLFVLPFEEHRGKITIIKMMMKGSHQAFSGLALIAASYYAHGIVGVGVCAEVQGRAARAAFEGGFGCSAIALAGARPGPQFELPPAPALRAAL